MDEVERPRLCGMLRSFLVPRMRTPVVSSWWSRRNTRLRQRLVGNERGAGVRAFAAGSGKAALDAFRAGGPGKCGGESLMMLSGSILRGRVRNRFSPWSIRRLVSSPVTRFSKSRSGLWVSWSGRTT
jgi:hypothetical protein